MVLNDRSVYQSLYRTVPSDDQLVSALATVMFFNNWAQLSVFTEMQPQFFEVKKYYTERNNKFICIIYVAIGTVATEA